jgi:hypothetical protein
VQIIRVSKFGPVFGRPWPDLQRIYTMGLTLFALTGPTPHVVGREWSAPLDYYGRSAAGGLACHAQELVSWDLQCCGARIDSASTPTPYSIDATTVWGDPADEHVVLSCSGWNSRQQGRDLPRPPDPTNRADRLTNSARGGSFSAARRGGRCCRAERCRWRCSRGRRFRRCREHLSRCCVAPAAAPVDGRTAADWDVDLVRARVGRHRARAGGGFNARDHPRGRSGRPDSLSKSARRKDRSNLLRRTPDHKLGQSRYGRSPATLAQPRINDRTGISAQGA